ncbi:MAG TPA: AI-2E family transporter [Thermoanaerobaculia bacterium]|nr:AI-2E family transporter [Thermoanaerobaculia bacterium]
MEIRSATAFRVAAIIFGLLIALRFLWIAHAIFIVTFLGVLLGLAVSRAVDFLEKIHLKRGIAAPLVIVVGLGVLVGIGALMAPSLRNQTQQLSTELPKLVDQADRWLQQTPARSLVQQPQQQPQQQSQQQSQQPQQQQQQKQQQGGLKAQLGKELRGSLQFLFPIVSSVFGAVGGFVLVIFIAMYVAAQPGVYREGILHLIPHSKRDRAEEYVDTLATTLRQWLVARLIAMVLIGLITGGGLALLGVKGAAALGLIAGLMEFVPFFGPIVSAIPALGIALLDSPQKALYVLILYLIVQQLEGNVITPLLLEKRLDIPPILTVVAVAALGVVFGVVGMLIAEPLLAVVLVTTKMLYVNDVVGDEVKVGKQE